MNAAVVSPLVFVNLSFPFSAFSCKFIFPFWKENVTEDLTLNYLLYFCLLCSVDKKSQNAPPKHNLSIIKDSSLHVLKCCFVLAPNTRDLDVFLRKQESGFGFRVLGGDGPDQPVSETVYSYLRVILQYYC